MKKLLFVLLSALISINTCFASGIAHVKTGEVFEIKAESVDNAKSYEWIITDESGEVLGKKDGKILQNKFLKKGVFFVNLNVKTSSETKKTTKVKIIVDDKDVDLSFTPKEELKSILETLPKKDAENTVHLKGDKSILSLIPSSSTGEIAQYLIDFNLDYDTDGDGDKTNDADNKDDPSFKTGAIMEFEVFKEYAPFELGLTVITKDGEKDSSKIKVVFNEEATEDEPIVANLSSFPGSDEQGIIHLDKDNGGEVSFFAASSSGNIIEYRIDKDIFTDSNKDGNPGNDIDNIQDASFRTGQMWKTTYQKTDNDIIAQLTIVSANGMGSRIQRGIAFDKETKNTIPEAEMQTEKIQKLIVSKTEIEFGESVNFTIFPGIENANISWDFDGDGNAEVQNQSNSLSYLYETAGEFEAKAEIINSDGQINVLTQKITVKKPDNIEYKAPEVDFRYVVDQNQVAFSSSATADSNLPRDDLFYFWDFGDGNVSSEKDPVHIYQEHGTFRIILNVSDIRDASSRKVQTVEIEEIAGITDQEGGIGGETKIDQDGNIIKEDGSKITPDGTEIDPEGTEIKPDGTQIKPDGTVIKPDGTIIEPDGTEIKNDGTVVNPDGSVEEPEIIEPDDQEETPTKTQKEKTSGGAWKWIICVLFFILFLAPMIYVLIEKIRNPSLSFEEIIEGIRDRFSGNKNEEQDLEKELLGDLHDDEEGLKNEKSQEENPFLEEKKDKAEDNINTTKTENNQDQKKLPDWLKPPTPTAPAIPTPASTPITPKPDQATPIIPKSVPTPQVKPQEQKPSIPTTQNTKPVSPVAPTPAAPAIQDTKAPT
ncbi:MAG: PKD domain-containing protein, partial [Candidatus Gracilibacteria bacterium]|nr:PKD domain-containing protein [Candidatus Gracilibacteria bacterium]